MEKVELIESYFDGALSPIELKEFQLKMENDPEFRDEVSFFKEVNTAITEDDISKLRKKLNSLFQPKEKIIKLKTTLSIIGSSAAAALLLFTWKAYGPTNTNKLYNKFFEPYEADFINRSVENINKSNTEFGLLLYENGNYEEAYHIFQNYLQDNYNNQTIKFFAAISALETDRTEEAIAALIEIIESDDALFEVKAKWYLSLAYIKEDEVENASKYLKELAATPNDYQDKAEDLLRKPMFKKIN